MKGKVQRRELLHKRKSGTVPGNILFDDFYNIPTGITETLSRLMQTKQLIYGTKGKLKPNIIPRNVLSPWYHNRMPTNRSCFLWNDIFFEYFKFIPRGCRNCWKVVIVTNKRPSRQRVLDLFTLRDILVRLNVPSKCGVDIRLHTPNRYSGFIYADNLEAGKRYYHLIKDALSTEFKNSTVILKKGCTEFEHSVGDSNSWDEISQARRWDNLEDYLNYIIETNDECITEGLFQQQNVDTFRYWIEYAHCIGDSSWRKALESQGYIVPKTLFPKPITYHEEK